MDKIVTVYLITNIINQKKYVGITTTTLNQRFKGHMDDVTAGSQRLLCRAIRKYGKENFIISEITKCENWALGCKIEEQKIKEFETFHELGKGYNLTLGGDGSPGYKLNSEQKENLRIAMEKFDKKELNKKRSETMKKHFQDPVWRAIQMKNLKEEGIRARGKEISQQHRENIRKSAIGRIQSEESNRKRSNTQKGRKPSPATILGIKKRWERIRLEKMRIA